jgi:uncharacterized membrane protein YdjX (TVP38/TMEM64 family)
MYKRILIFTWFVGVVIFLSCFYTYAFIHGMGVLGALRFFGEVIQGFTLRAGMLAPLLFILLYTLRPLVLFPASIMTVTSVFVFGLYGGFVVSYVGEMFSAFVAYIVGKYFGGTLHLLKNVRESHIRAYISENAFLSVFLLRLVPVFPFDFVNYACGIMHIRFSSYAFGTLLGVLPGLSAYIFLGFSLIHTEYLFYAILALLLLFSLTYITKK